MTVVVFDTRNLMDLHPLVPQDHPAREIDTNLNCADSHHEIGKTNYAYISLTGLYPVFEQERI